MKNLLNKAAIFALLVTSSAIASQTDSLSTISNGSLEASGLNHLNPSEMSQITASGYTYARNLSTSRSNTRDISVDTTSVAINANQVSEPTQTRAHKVHVRIL